MRTFVTIFAVVANLALADAITKELAAARLKGEAAVSVVPGFFNLAYVENRGAAWGLFQGQVWPLAAFGVAALGFLVWKRRAVFGDAWVAPCLMYAGIVGNLIDRIFRGFVIDMLDFHWGASHFPCFNLADTYICVAAGLLILASFLERREGPAAR